MAEAKKPVAVAKKAEVKKTEVKAAPVVEEKKVVESPKAATKKTTAKKAAAPKAAAEKKAPAKKTTTKTAAKKTEAKASLFVQFQGRDYSEETLISMAKEAYVAAGNKDALKTINVYANVDDQVAYYVANDSIEGRFNI